MPVRWDIWQATRAYQRGLQSLSVEANKPALHIYPADLPVIATTSDKMENHKDKWGTVLYIKSNLLDKVMVFGVFGSWMAQEGQPNILETGLRIFLYITPV